MSQEYDSMIACCRKFFDRAWWTKVCNRYTLIAIGLGQFLSLLVCGTATTSGLLERQNVKVPTAQSFLNYVLLCLIFFTWYAYQCGQKGMTYSGNAERCCLWFFYFFVALVDVEANYLIVKAYHYTTVTSVQLLDCFAIPTVLLLSRCFLNIRYNIVHYVGVSICLVGVGALVLADILMDSKALYAGASNKLLGDIMCLVGAVLYGVSNVCQEYLVRRRGMIEYMGSIGLFGSILNGIQLAVLERNELMGVNFTSASVVIPMAGFTVCLFLLYVLMPLVIEKTSAMAVNLNLLSSDFYALLLGLFVFHYKFHLLYFASFGLIIVGIILYTVRPPMAAAISKPDDSVCCCLPSFDTLTSLLQLFYRSGPVPIDFPVCDDSGDVAPAYCEDSRLMIHSSDTNTNAVTGLMDRTKREASSLSRIATISLVEPQCDSVRQQLCTHL